MISTTIRLGISCAVLTGAFSFGIACIQPSYAQQVSPAKTLTVEDIYAHGTIGGRPPQGLTWSPNGEHLTYLDGGELIDLDPGTAKSHVMVSRSKLTSLSTTAASEKDRDHRQRYGMASYLWSPDSARLLFDANGSYWLYDLKTGTGLNVGSSGAGSGDDPKFSPDGRFVSFINDNGTEHGLSVIRLREPGSPTNAVATTANAAVLNGKVDWVYEEELDVRSNYFWAPDSAHLAFLQMDESNVPQYPLTDWIPQHTTVDMQRYPQPGDPNPAVRVGVVGPMGGKVVWIKLPADQFKPGDDYIPRFGWIDRKYVWIETLTRNHKHRNIYFADVSNGNAKLMLAQQDDKFFDEKYDISIADGAIVLSSWQDGHEHLYLYGYKANNPLDGQATMVRQLTKGDFDVDEVLRVDHTSKTVVYTSNEGAPLDQQIWMVTFDGEKTEVTTASGTHQGSFPPRGNFFVDRFSNRMTPESVSLCRVGGACNLFWSTRAYELYRLRAPEQFEVKTSDGISLYATILLPEGKSEQHSVPLILNPYGGPGPMTVSNHFGGDGFLFDELLAQHGFAVLHTDNRGTGRRGRDFAQFAYHNFGPIQLQDQLTVADAALAKYPQLDPKRQGWWGWSWGGTFTLYAMSHSDRFRAGVSVAPVTDWKNYDSIYTERYMSEPGDFPDGYKDFSVVNSATNLHGHLLLVHGTGDDNVHMQNMVQYVQQLILNNKPYDLQIFPRKTHSIAGTEVRPFLFNRILQQFETYLMPVTDETGK
ncbi:alpha/beta fold hydrolase [Acidicapsa dinghuensis]|uniref:Alpha/beta fold hydrolase n=1 Tax=Acidicapsa dinghuensis TaxID=2218256 RepID=A0ABW1EBD1_9BACT|nr:alpha/beta fold hydrolase [Acidicapsa dinghuensis]